MATDSSLDVHRLPAQIQAPALNTGAPLLSSACSEAMTGDVPHLRAHPTSPELRGGRPARATRSSPILTFPGTTDIPLSADHAVPSPEPNGAILPSLQISTEPSPSQTGEEDDYNHDGVGRRSVLEWLVQVQIQVPAPNTDAPILSAACLEAMTVDLPHLHAHPMSQEFSGGRPTRAPPASLTLTFPGTIDILLSTDHAVLSPDPDNIVPPSRWISTELSPSQTGEEDDYNNDGGGSRDKGGKTTVLGWLIQLLLRMWKTCKKSEQLLPITDTPRTNPSPDLEQSMSDTLKALSKAKYMVFSGFLAVLCGLLSVNLGSNNTTTTTRSLIRSCNYATAIGSICIVVSIPLPFILPRSFWFVKLLFFIAIGLLSICILLCSLFIHMSIEQS